MRRPPGWLVAAVAGAIVWLAAPALPWPARALTALLVGILPVLAVAQLRLIGDPAEIPRMSAYASTMITLWALAGLVALAAAGSGYSVRTLGVVRLPVLPTFVWAAAITLAAILIGLVLQRAGLRESPLLLHLLPDTRRERVTFAALSVTAGVCEELVFRGFLIATLAHASGSTAFAVLASTVVFGLVHAYQRWAGAARAAVLGAILTTPVLFAGSVIPAMIAHTTIDLIGGLWLRDRYTP